MSLITLNSNGQDPYFYANHFPQPISIKPYSQVCLLKFLHFRDSLVFNITTSNNTLLFCIGNTKQDGLRVVKLNVGQYTGEELATEIASSMNSVLQQQNYLWACVFTPEDDTTSPPTKEKFEISYSTVATPAASIYAMTQKSNKITITTPTGTINTIQEFSTSDGSLDFATLGTNGLITNEGQLMVDNIGFAYNVYSEDNLALASNYGFNDLVIGVCRDELAHLDNSNIHLNLNPYIQDLSIELNATGIEISGIKIAGNATIGTSGYASAKLCRTIPNDALQKLITGVAGKTVADIANMRFKFTTTILGTSRRAIIQMQVSYDSGRTYAVPAANPMGNDGQGNPFQATFTTGGGDNYTGAIWVSDKATFNDNGAGGTNLAIQNLVITKKAPFKPNINLIESQVFIGPPILQTAGLAYTDSGGDVVAFSLYTGVHGYNLIANVDGGKTYYMVQDNKLNPTTYTNIHAFKASETDVAHASATFGTITYSPVDDAIAVVDSDGTTDTWSDSSATTIEAKQMLRQPLNTNGIMNGVNRPVSNFNAVDGLPALTDDEIHVLFNAEEPDNTLNTDPAQVGTDLERQAILLLRQLTVADVAANTGAPAYLTNGQRSGSLGAVIGSSENIIVGTSSGGQTIFTSDSDTQKISKDTIISVSVPELSGVKSFNGIDNGAGRDLSGEGKNLAVLPREEFQTRGENANGSLVYVAPFENWININNATELNLNQLSVEVRQPGGQLATDLRPDTITQLKMREDPLKVEERMANDAHLKLIGALSAATNTSQTLSNTIYNNGS